MKNQILEITDDNFETEVSKSKEPVMIDFYAEWCKPCIIMASTIEELKEEFDGKVKITKLNIEENSEIAKKFNISNIPAILLFKNGKVVDRHIGLRSKKDIKKDLEGVVA